MLAAAALVKCRGRIAIDEVSTIAACDVSREVDGLDGSAAAKKVARSLARSLQLALVGKVADQPDPDRRLVAALSGVFDATCYAADMTKTLGCPALLDVAPDDYAKTVMPLALARGMLEAAVERDTNRMVTTAVATVTAETSALDALEVLLARKISAVPVVDATGHLQGIVTSTDFLSLAYRALRGTPIDAPHVKA